jgi:hypothetical protein
VYDWQLLKRVNRAFKSRAGLLSETDDLVENQIPVGVEPLSRDHALFLFYTVANDHGMKSSRLYAKAKRVFLNRRDLFEPAKIVANFAGPQDPELVDETGKQLGTRYPKETAKSWYVNSERLLERYDGDPRNLFRYSSDAQELLRAITAFRGYGPKIGGMLLRAVIGLRFAEVSGIEKVLVPVDIHDSRISFLTGVLKLSDRTEDRIDYYAYVRQVQEVLLSACNSVGIRWPDVDRALWLIGSRGCVNKRCGLCPLCDVCSIGSNTTPNNPQLALPL